MWLKFVDDVRIRVSEVELAEMTVLSQSLLAQTLTTDETELDLSQLIVSDNQLSQSDVSAIISAQFETNTVDQLLNYVLICNYLGWDSKLPLLYHQLAKRLCTASLEDNNAAIVRKMSRPATVDGYDQYYSHDHMYSQSNAGTALTSDSFKLLWLWRHRVFGPPTECEKTRLQLQWWLLNCDPKSADTISVTSPYDTSGISAALAKLLTITDSEQLDKLVTLFQCLEVENVKEILLQCWVPVYFGDDNCHERRWSQFNDDIITISPVVKSAEHGVIIFTNPALNCSFMLSTGMANSLGVTMPKEISVDLVKAGFEIMLFRFCSSQELILRLNCLSLVCSWCNVAMTNSGLNTSTTTTITTTTEEVANDDSLDCTPRPVVTRDHDSNRTIVTNIGSHNRDVNTPQWKQHPDFDVDFYMLRPAADINSEYQFRYEDKVREQLKLDKTELMAINCYTDIVNTVWELVRHDLPVVIGVLMACFPLPPCYYSILTMLKELIAANSKIRRVNTKSEDEATLVGCNVLIMDENATTKELLLTKTDNEIQDLCHEYNILIVDYDRELAAKTLSNYYVDI